MEFLSKLLGNPWALAGIFATGLALGTTGAWTVQGYRLDAARATTNLIQHDYDTFKAEVAAQGEAAQKAAEAAEKAYQVNKEKADNDYQISLARLTDDNRKLRDQAARTPRSFLSPAAPTSSRPDLACYDRAEFDAALSEFVQQSRIETTGILAEGDENTLMLNNARQWAQK